MRWSDFIHPSKQNILGALLIRTKSPFYMQFSFFDLYTTINIIIILFDAEPALG